MPISFLLYGDKRTTCRFIETFQRIDMKIKLEKIISGGQTGADRGALDAAMSAGIQLGGWCPLGRLAEDGIIPEKYPLSETETNQYAERTELNVMDSDATLIVLHEKTTGKGTKLTENLCGKHKKPCLKIQILQNNALETVGRWLQNNNVKTLNVAGNRESEDAGIEMACFNFMKKLFSAHGQ